MNVVQTYTAPGVYMVGLKVKDAQGLSDTDTVTVTVTPPAPSDLRVTAISATTASGKGREGEKATLKATVRNSGAGAAPASKTEFLLDGTKVLGLVDTPALAAGASAEVSVIWDTRKVKGDHQLKATADKPERDRRVERDEQQRHADRHGEGQQGAERRRSRSRTPPAPAPTAGARPAARRGATRAPTARRRASAQGSERRRSPTWTSAPVAVVPGEVLDLRRLGQRQGNVVAGERGRRLPRCARQRAEHGRRC